MKNNLLRIFVFLILVLLGFSGPSWLFAVGVVAYVFVYLGLEIIILAAAVDAYYGYASEGLFVYTIAVALGLLLMQWLKPYLTMYNQ